MRKHKIKGGVFINTGYTIETAFHFFLENSTYEVLYNRSFITDVTERLLITSSGGLMIKLFLNDGIESPYSMSRSNFYGRPVTEILIKIVFLSDTPRPFRMTGPLTPTDTRRGIIIDIVSSTRDEFESEVGTQIDIFKQSLKRERILNFRQLDGREIIVSGFEPICPTIIACQQGVSSADFIRLFPHTSPRDEVSQFIIRYLIDNYTNEAGVRDIKRKIEEIYLHLNIDMIYGRGLFKQTKKKIKQITLTQKEVVDILKEPDTYKRNINDMPEVGIIAGLYATSNGSGGITPIQIYPNMQHSNNKYEVKLTGKQGEIMKESVICSLTTAIEWLKKNNYNVEELMKHHVKNGFHVHTPDGATPKDGPSAGCAFTCAFISRILNRPIKNDIAMTGEIELTGKISKIGGLEFKLQGAKKAGIKTVYVPFENKKDIDMIKEKYKNLIDDSFIVKTVSEINEIINEILI